MKKKNEDPPRCENQNVAPTGKSPDPTSATSTVTSNEEVDSKEPPSNERQQDQSTTQSTVKQLVCGNVEITEANTYNIDEKYEGYLFIRKDGHVEFYKKEKRNYKNGLLTTKSTDLFTIQENSKLVKITMVAEKEGLSFDKLLKSIDNLMKTMSNMKLI